MTKIISFSAPLQDKALHMMTTGEVLNATDKRSIIKARAFPKETEQNADLLKFYLISEEGLERIIKDLTSKELMVLHILYQNNWVVDISFFAAAYTKLTKSSGYGYGTFTQRYQETFKIVKKKLIRKGLILCYMANATPNTTKLERWRFFLPKAVADQLPPPFKTTTLKGVKPERDNSYLRHDLQLFSIPKRQTHLRPVLILSKQSKITLNNRLFDETAVQAFQLKVWNEKNGGQIEQTCHDKGLTLGTFLCQLWEQLAEPKWFKAEELTDLLQVWYFNWAVERLERMHYGGGTLLHIPDGIKAARMCVSAWKCGLLEQAKKDGKVYYRPTTTPSTTVSPATFCRLDAAHKLYINTSQIPLTDLGILNQLGTWQLIEAGDLQLQPDLTALGQLPEHHLQHPTVQWLKKEVPVFTKAFDKYKKNFGKKIIHQGLLVAKISDLSLKVSVEKLLGDQVVSLSDEFIAFPKNYLPKVERLVIKSGNVVKRVG